MDSTHRNEPKKISSSSSQSAASTSEINLLANIATTLTPLETFEKQKKQFILKNPVNSEQIDWTPLFKNFQDYADAIDTQDIEEEDSSPLTQLPDLEYEQQCLIEETRTQNRRVAESQH